MNLDLFLVQKVIQSLFKNNVNATLSSLETPLEEEKQKQREISPEKREPSNTSECEKQKKQEKQEKRKIIEVYSMLFDQLNAANAYVNMQKNSGCFECQEIDVDIDSQIPRPKSFSTTYITPEISQYITNESKKILTFECKIKARLIHLHFILFNNNNNSISYYKVLVHRVYMWLSMISDKSKCIETLNIYI